MELPIYSIIMAGGSGERFWPVSRKARPKQLLYLTNDSSMMVAEAVDRLLPIVPKERILIATNRDLQPAMLQALSDHPQNNIIGEPVRRDTTGGIAYAAAHALSRFANNDNDFLMSITTADHLIGDNERFRNSVSAALQFAQNEDALITIGLHPTRPETGYGYIEITELHQPLTESFGVPIYKVCKFLEKPSLEDAESYQASRFFYWNSGMFFWRFSTFLASMKKALPQVADSILEMATELRNSNPAKADSIFATLPNISIDYALMEKADNVYVALGDFRWDDVGSWGALARFRKRDENRNTVVGDPILLDCKNVTVYNEPGSEEMVVCALGLKDTIVVTTKDAVLVCANNRAQDVKKAIETLKKHNAKQM